MAKDKKSFLLYCDIKHTVNELTDEQAGKLFKHILAYVNDENPQTDDILIKIAFEPIKQSLKRDLQKYENIRAKNKENALKRWNADASKKIPNDATASERMRMDTKNADSVSDSDSVSVSNNKRIPSYSEFESYALTKRPEVDTSHLKAKFESWVELGWKDGHGNKILNWKSKLLSTLPYLKSATRSTKEAFVNDFFDKIKTEDNG